jgi:hypothetical protein
MTLKELETESETMEAMNPMNASRRSQTPKGCLGGSAIASERKLYYTTIQDSFFNQKYERRLTVANQG